MSYWNWKAIAIVAVAGIGSCAVAFGGAAVVADAFDRGGFLDGVLEAALFLVGVLVACGSAAAWWAGASRQVGLRALLLGLVALAVAVPALLVGLGFLAILAPLVPWGVALRHAARRPA